MRKSRLIINPDAQKRIVLFEKYDEDISSYLDLPGIYEVIKDEFGEKTLHVYFLRNELTKK